MIDLFKLILGVLTLLFRSRAQLEAEILVLRQQINVLRRRPVDGRSVYVPPLWATVPGLADVSQQPCRRYRGGRPLCAANGRLPDSLLSCHPTPRTTVLDVVWCDIKSDRGVDLASDYRGVPVGPCTSIPHQGSGQVVWIGLRAASVRYGHSRPADRPAITLAKCLR